MLRRAPTDGRPPVEALPPDSKETQAASRAAAEKAKQAANEAAAKFKPQRLAEIVRIVKLLKDKDAFLDKQEEEKEEQEKQAQRKNYLAYRAELIKQLFALYPEVIDSFPEDKAAKEKEAKASEPARTEATKIEELRTYLRATILQNETPATKAFCDKAFQVQIMLAEQWPTNDLDPDTGWPIDPIYLTDGIDPGKRVPAASGIIYEKDSLQEHLSRNTAFRVDPATNRLEVLDPNRKPFTERELDFFERQCKVKIPQRDENLRAAVGWTRALGQGGERVGGAAGFNARRVLNPILNLFIRFRHARAFVGGMVLGGVGGGFLGLFIGLCMVVMIASSVTPIGLPAVFAVGALCGVIEHKRQGGSGFWKGFGSGLLGGALTFGLAYLGPLLIAGLGAASLISSASVAAGTALWTSILQPLVPAIVGALAAVREYFSPGAVKRTFNNIYKFCLAVPTVLTAAAGALIGGVTGVLVSIGASIVSCFRRNPQPAPRDGVAAAGVEGANAGLQPERDLSQGARLRLAVGQSSVAEGEYSPRTRQAIADALSEDGEDPAAAAQIQFLGGNGAGPRRALSVTVEADEAEAAVRCSP